MKHRAVARRSSISLGIVYLVLGAAETARLLLTGAGGFFFWFGTLVGGGSLLLLGALPRRPVQGGRRSLAVVAGAALGVPATAWTVVVPLLAITVVALTITSPSGSVPAGPEPVDRR